MVNQISAQALAEWLADPAREKPLLLDVREPWEFERCAIAGAEPMPMGTVPLRAGELDQARDIVCVCHHGGRSMQVAMFLAQRGFTKLHNLSGGVHAWALEVDRSMPTY